MTDRELIERAARAQGWRVISYSESGTSVVPGGTAVVVAEGRTFGWRPLADDGYALRLAVQLHMTVRCHMGSTCAQIGVPGQPNAYVDETNHADPASATRRAIVRAAAAIAPEVRT